MGKKCKGILFLMIFATISLVCWGRPVQLAMKLTDVSGSWADSQITYLARQGVINGYWDGTYRPEQAITRAEFITMINRAFNYTDAGKVIYSDVKPGAWYYDEIRRAQAAGYISGYPDSIMKPNNPVSRQEAAAVMSLVLKLKSSDQDLLPFSDTFSLDDRSRNYIKAMVQAGLLTGYPDGTFRPFAPVTRAEAAAIIVKGAYPAYPETVAGFSYNIMDYGAKGTGRTDDTAAINKTINVVSEAGGGTVHIPDGTYLIDVDTAIRPKSNTKLVLANGAVLKAKPTSSSSNAVIRISNVDNVEISGGKIIGDRDTHVGTKGEWGHGITLLNADNVTISDIVISDCWGDGIYVSGSPQKRYSTNVLIERVICDNNRRQGLSIISVKGMIVRDSDFINTNGTNPQSGIDVEPNNVETEWIQGLLIENVRTANNQGWGIAMTWGYFQKTRNPSDITIRNCTDSGSKKGAIRPWDHLLSPICEIEVI